MQPSQIKKHLEEVKFTDKHGTELKAGDYISFGDKPELLYSCNDGDVESLGVNASRHYPGSELYPLSAFSYITREDGSHMLLDAEKVKGEK